MHLHTVGSVDRGAGPKQQPLEYGDDSFRRSQESENQTLTWGDNMKQLQIYIVQWPVGF